MQELLRDMPCWRGPDTPPSPEFFLSGLSTHRPRRHSTRAADSADKELSDGERHRVRLERVVFGWDHA
ncbi:hypothetical protein GCM10009747_29360 [Agromyces humatus]|uniref:Uncharacterized protein n=1 Tax=Agromyces humatus TaxID=279573 RepID=A0ABP4X419_9MICO